MGVPLMSLYCHLIIYLFLPISRKSVALGTGLAVSAICLVMFIVIELTYNEDEGPRRVAWQAGADAVYYMTLNLIGFYVRYVGEINMRRGFLDKRQCIETTFKLKYEKEQEENLLLSIIPKQIATQVRDGI